MFRPLSCSCLLPLCSLLWTSLTINCNSVQVDCHCLAFNPNFAPATCFILLLQLALDQVYRGEAAVGRTYNLRSVRPPA